MTSGCINKIDSTCSRSQTAAGSTSLFPVKLNTSCTRVTLKAVSRSQGIISESAFLLVPFAGSV